MPRSLWIRDLELGQNVRLQAQIRSVDVRKTKAGSLYLVFTLGDKTGTIPAMLWGQCAADCPDLQRVRFAEVRGSVGEYRGRLQIHLAAYPRELGMPDDLSDYLQCSPLPLAELRARLFRHIDSVENHHLHAVLLEVFDRDRRLAARFMEHPAAQSMHHAFRHGLLHHTLEVADLVASMAEKQSGWGWRAVNRDLAVTGALLHDIGKTQELEEADHWYRYSPGGELLGHITLGHLMVARAVAKVRKRTGFPETLEHMLLHLISSHHGNGEWGSPEPPKTMEALLLHAADRTSADLYYFQEAAKQAGEDEQFAKQFKLDPGVGGQGRRIFVGDVGSLLQEGRQAYTLSADDADKQEKGDEYNSLSRSTQTAEEWENSLPEREVMRLPVLRMVEIEEDGEVFEGMRALPLVGRVAAGTRVFDSANREGLMLVEAEGLSPAGHYLLRVQGDSMRGDGIGDGDVVVVQQQEIADAQAIVVVQVPDAGAVIKRLERTAEGIRLLSSNPAFPPIEVAEPERLRIQGVVVGIARS